MAALQNLNNYKTNGVVYQSCVTMSGDFTNNYGLWIKEKKLPEIKEIIFNYKTTIVNWMDGTKTVSVCQEEDVFDEYVGVSLCITKKMFHQLSGSKHMRKALKIKADKETRLKKKTLKNLLKDK